MSEFIPNSFQLPNIYVDRCMDILTPEEWKVLTYICRRIFGFNKRQDRIALSQLCDGIKANDGRRLDGGTGLGRETVRAALAALVDFGLVLKMAENDPQKNQGPLYALQLDDEKVNWSALEKRTTERAEAYAERMAKARKALVPPTVAQTPYCDTDAPPTVAQYAPPYCGTDTQYTRETQSGNTVLAQQAAPSAPEPAPEPETPKPSKKKGDQLDGMLHFARQAEAQLYNCAHFPADVSATLTRFCELFKIRPPQKGANDYSMWIKAARDLKTACGEFGLAALERAHQDYLALTDGRRYMVVQPLAFVKACRAAESTLRAEQEAKDGAYDPMLDDGSAEYQAALAAWKNAKSLAA